jgi:hypothetical protein
MSYILYHSDHGAGEQNRRCYEQPSCRIHAISIVCLLMNDAASLLHPESRMVQIFIEESCDE